MATFRVGQRVKIVSADAETQFLIGVESTVRKIMHHEDFCHLCESSITYMMADRFNGRRVEACGCSLEPIQPERNQVIAWSECLWQPKVRADA